MTTLTKTGRKPTAGYRERNLAEVKRLLKNGTIAEVAGADVAAKLSGSLSMKVGGSMPLEPGMQRMVGGFLKSVLATRRRMLAVQSEVARNRKEARDLKIAPVYRSHELELASQGILFRPAYRLPYQELYMLADSDLLTGSIHQVRRDQVEALAEFDKDAGYYFRPAGHRDDEVSDVDRARIEQYGRLFELMGIEADALDGRDTIDDVLGMATADLLVYDKVCYFVTFTPRGRIHSIQYLDPATVFRVNEERAKAIQPPWYEEGITHVQVIDGVVEQVFPRGRIVMMNRNKSSNIRHRDEGRSPTEGSAYGTLALIYGMKGNLDRFQGHHPPRGFFSSAEYMDEEEIARIEAQWETQFYGQRDEFVLPFVTGVGDMQWHKLDADNGSLEWKDLTFWTATLVLSRHGTDPAELGLRLSEAQTLSEASIDERARQSRERVLRRICKFHAKCFNRILQLEQADAPVFFFPGITDDDADTQLERLNKKAGSFLPMDLVLKEAGYPSMEEIAKAHFERRGLQGPEVDALVERYGNLGLLIANQVFAGELTGELMPPQGPAMEEEQGDAPDYDQFEGELRRDGMQPYQEGGEDDDQEDEN